MTERITIRGEEVILDGRQLQKTNSPYVTIIKEEYLTQLLHFYANGITSGKGIQLLNCNKQIAIQQVPLTKQEWKSIGHHTHSDVATAPTQTETNKEYILEVPSAIVDLVGVHLFSMRVDGDTIYSSHLKVTNMSIFIKELEAGTIKLHGDYTWVLPYLEHKHTVMIEDYYYGSCYTHESLAKAKFWDMITTDTDIWVKPEGIATSTDPGRLSIMQEVTITLITKDRDPKRTKTEDLRLIPKTDIPAKYVPAYESSSKHVITVLTGFTSRMRVLATSLPESKWENYLQRFLQGEISRLGVVLNLNTKVCNVRELQEAYIWVQKHHSNTKDNWVKQAESKYGLIKDIYDLHAIFSRLGNTYCPHYGIASIEGQVTQEQILSLVKTEPQACLSPNLYHNMEYLSRTGILMVLNDHFTVNHI